MELAASSCGEGLNTWRSKSRWRYMSCLLCFGSKILSSHSSSRAFEYIVCFLGWCILNMVVISNSYSVKITVPYNSLPGLCRSQRPKWQDSHRYCWPCAFSTSSLRNIYGSYLYIILQVQWHCWIARRFCWPTDPQIPDWLSMDSPLDWTSTYCNWTETRMRCQCSALSIFPAAPEW